jgi:hypothetical protein
MMAIAVSTARIASNLSSKAAIYRMPFKKKGDTYLRSLCQLNSGEATFPRECWNMVSLNSVTNTGVKFMIY